MDRVRIGWSLLGALGITGAVAQPPPKLLPVARGDAGSRARVVIFCDAEATEAFQPNPQKVAALVNRGLTDLTGKASVAAAWLSLVSTQDTVGIKVYSEPGLHSGTRPAVVAAVVEGLIESKVLPSRIVIWDRHRDHLRKAGFFELGARYGVNVQGCDGAGYDEKTFYLPDRRIIGQLVWGDLEFGRQGETVGLKSFVSKLVSQQITKIINITPLLNHNSAGVCGNLCSLAMGSVDNTIRFEVDPARLASAVPEIYALPAVGDKVALSILDALVCQYQGEKEPRLHYAKALNEIWLSRDPVALDFLGLLELDRQRKNAGMATVSTNFTELYQNAALLDLGVIDPNNIQVERSR
jgi:hypothetical protein